ncbi:hypothetical protein V8D89_002909, partial [Ganoderma adspersum]
QPGGLGVFWLPYPPQPVFNPWMGSPYPIVGQLSGQTPFLHQSPGPGECSGLFQWLVAAVSKEIKDNEQKAAKKDVDKKNAVPNNLSIENEKALIDALREQKEGKLTMEQLTSTIEWKTWFFANYERLISKVDPNPKVGRASEDGSGSTSFISPVASHSHSASINWSPQSSTISIANTLPDSCEESESGWEELSSFDEISTSHKYHKLPPQSCHVPKLCVETTINTNTPSTPVDKPVRRARNRVLVTDEDLHMMVLYRFERGDDCEVHRYSYSCWHGFAQRPEVSVRLLMLAAWTCVPRVPSHADAIDRYVREYQLQAEVPESKPPLSILPPTKGGSQVSSLGNGTQFGLTYTGAQGDSKGLKNVTSASQSVGWMEIIDLTGEREG